MSSTPLAFAAAPALAGTDPTFLSMTLDAYKYGELVIVANEVVSDTSFDIVGFVMANIGRALGQKIDVDLIVVGDRRSDEEDLQLPHPRAHEAVVSFLVDDVGPVSECIQA